MRKFLLILAGLIVVIAIACGVIYFKHPIISKWLSDTARNIGKPIDATVYVNGHINDRIKVYRDKKFKNDYIVSFVEINEVGALFKYIDIDLEKKMVGRPGSVATEDYDVVMGSLFMSDIAEHVTDVSRGNDFTFDPKLSFTKNEIRFKIPAPSLNLDSMKIVLNDVGSNK
ncbi:MAG: hypothetical protein ACHQHN_05750 [Sphingobacteriales bacterium]